MLRTTSVLAYRQIFESGVLGTQAQMLKKLYETGGSFTDNEAYEILKPFLPPRFGPHLISARRDNLIKMGLVGEAGTRSCAVTNNEVMSWKLKQRIPSSLRPEVIKKLAQPSLSIF